MGKNNTPRTPRKDYVYSTTSGEVDEIVIHIDQEKGEFSFGTPMTNVYAETSYDRKKGPKSVFRLPQRGQSLTFDIDKILRRDFDYICAVDTNTKKVQNRPISVTAIVHVKPQNIVGPEEISQFWNIDVPLAIEFQDIKVSNPENMRWLAAFEQLISIGKISTNQRIGMIVDSDLGNLNDYNHQRKPVFQNFLLPPNLTLIYASADTGKDSILNQALSIADSIATQTIFAVETGVIKMNDEVIDSEFYKGIRFIFPKSKQ